MSWMPLTPIHTWKVRRLVVPKTLTRYSMTSHVSTPSVRVAAKMPGAPVPSRSVQNGASMLFGSAGFGPAGRLQQLLSSRSAAAGHDVAVGVDADTCVLGRR